MRQLTGRLYSMTSAQDSVRVKKPAGACGRVLCKQTTSQSSGGPLLLPARRDPRQSWLAWTGLNLLSSSPKATKRTRIAFTFKSSSLVRHFLPPPTPPTNTSSYPTQIRPRRRRLLYQPHNKKHRQQERRSLASSAKMWIINWCMLLPPSSTHPRGQLADMKVSLPPCSLRRPLVARPAQQARQAAVPRPRQCRKDDAAAHAEGASPHHQYPPTHGPLEDVGRAGRDTTIRVPLADLPRLPSIYRLLRRIVE